jgi:Mce-associated membrane protein
MTPDQPVHPEPATPDQPQSPETPETPEVPEGPAPEIPNAPEAPRLPEAEPVPPVPPLPELPDTAPAPGYAPPALPTEPPRTGLAETPRAPFSTASAEATPVVASAQVDTVAIEPERTQETEEAGTADRPRAAGRPVRVLAGLGALLLVATIVLGVLALIGRPSATLSDSERASAVKAARADATTIFSFDYRHLDADFKAGLAVSTGTFKQEYTRTTTKLVQDLVPKYKAVTIAQVSTAGIVSTTKDSAVVLVFFNQQASSTLLKAPRVTQNRIEMTMVREGNGWLVSKVRAL